MENVRNFAKSCKKIIKIRVLLGGSLPRSMLSTSSSTVSVRRLPPLPINSLPKTAITTTASATVTTSIITSAQTMTTSLFSSPTIVSCPLQQVSKEDHRYGSIIPKKNGSNFNNYGKKLFDKRSEIFK